MNLKLKEVKEFPMGSSIEIKPNLSESKAYALSILLMLASAV